MTDDAVRAALANPEPVIEDILEKMDAGTDQTIYGPDGKALFDPLIDDRTLTYAKDGESYSIEPTELLMKAARMQRDGMSLAAIAAELDLVNVPPSVLEKALVWGHQLLADAIAEGREPEESKRVVGYIEARDDDTNEATTEDALEVGRRLARDWVAR